MCEALSAQSFRGVAHGFEQCRPGGLAQLDEALMSLRVYSDGRRGHVPSLQNRIQIIYVEVFQHVVPHWHR